MLGLWIAEEESPAVKELLRARMIPLEGFTDAAAGFDDWTDQEDFLRQAAACILRGEPLPMEGVATCLSGAEALPGNVIRKYVCLQLSLAPYLRKYPQVRAGEGCLLLGEDLAVLPLGEEGRIDALLPAGTWTELATGETFSGRVRRIRRVHEMPVLARENALVPIGVEDRRTDGDDADRVTLHWCQPMGEARCALADGTWYAVHLQDGKVEMESNSAKAWHLVLRKDGEVELVR